MITREKSCGRKIRHATRGGAIAHLKSLGNAQMHAYQCNYCKGWHIGHSNRPGKLQARFDQLMGPDPNLKKSR
jgi:hypothetical protein